MSRQRRILTFFPMPMPCSPFIESAMATIRPRGRAQTHRDGPFHLKCPFHHDSHAVLDASLFPSDTGVVHDHLVKVSVADVAQDARKQAQSRRPFSTRLCPWLSA